MTGTWHSSTAHHKSPYNIRISFNSGLRVNITELSAGCISTVSERKVLGGCTACSVIRWCGRQDGTLLLQLSIITFTQYNTV